MAVLDLSSTEIERYWHQYPMLNEVFSSMHEIESWVIDPSAHFKLDNAINTWANNLDDEQASRLPDKAEALVILLYFLPARSSLYLYKVLTDLNPAIDRALQISAMQMLKDDDLKNQGIVFWDRLHHLFVDKAISEMFDETRLETLKRCINEVNKNLGSL